MKLLDVYLREIQNKEFVWLENDCVSIARGWVMLATGVDPVPEYYEYSKSKDLIAAFKAFRRGGGFAAVGARFGEPVPPLMARRGDIVLVESGGRVGRVSGYTYGINTGDRIVVPVRKHLDFLDITEGKSAWRLSRNSPR